MRTYNFNQNYFDIINTEDRAYWLGFLYADGCLAHRKHCVILELSKKDESHLDKYKNAISCESPLYYNRGCAKLRVYSKTNWLNLYKLGCLPNKSKICSFPSYNQVPENLIHHFIRGVFDGDGTVYWLRDWLAAAIYSASIKFIVGLQGALYEYSELCRPVQSWNKANPYYVLKYYKKSDLLKLYNYMYKDATVYLDRKKTLFDLIKNG